MHLGTAPNSRAAHSLVRHTLLITVAFAAFISVMGLGTSALIGKRAISATDPTGDQSVNLLTIEVTRSLSSSIGGVLFTVLAASAAFIATLAVVAGLSLAVATTLAHDVYAPLITKGKASQADEVSAARWFSAAVGVLFSPVTSGNPAAFFPQRNFSSFHCTLATLISVTLASLLGGSETLRAAGEMRRPAFIRTANST